MTIAEYFADHDEAAFREIEEEVIAGALRRRPAVVLALGGGALGSVLTRHRVLDEALLVHLDQSFEELAPALRALAPGRPLLAGRDESEVRALYDERRELYLVAPVQVRTGREGLSVALARVLEALRVVGVVRDEALP
jgi:shikimate kinase